MTSPRPRPTSTPLAGPNPRTTSPRTVPPYGDGARSGTDTGGDENHHLAPTETGEVKVIILELGPAPAKPLSLNEERGLHWSKRCARTDPWRDLTIVMARQARLARAVCATPSTVTVVIPVGDNRRRDPANYYPVVKACIDGLVKAKVWPDDDPAFVRVNEPILTRAATACIRIEPRWEQLELPIGGAA